MNHYPHLDWARAMLLLHSILLFSACGGQDHNGHTAQHAPTKQEASGQQAAPSPPEPLAPTPADPDGRGALVGRVVFDGDTPQPQALTVSKDVEVCGKTEKFPEALLVGPDRGIKNAVVFLRAVTGGNLLSLPASNPVIDQLDCIYTPHVLLVPAGATVDIKNSDGILHNIHTYSQKNPAFNTAQPKFKTVISKTFAQPEIIRVTCDVHDWMTAWVVVQDHPYYALTDATGAFRLSDVPPGEYELKVWHEELGEHPRSVSITADQESSVKITLARAG